jgi:hypothetical protein
MKREMFWGKEGIIVVEGVGDFFGFSFGKLRGIVCVFLFLVGGMGIIFKDANKNLKG